MLPVMIILGWLSFWVLVILGWIFNVIALAKIISDPITGIMVLRAIGVPFVPLGSILGWFV
jgi:hypothetical protein